MSVYVDNFYITGVTFRGMKMSHMIADTSKELMSMADKIGIQKKWIQDINTNREHFDICLNKRSAAIKAGAIPITFRELANKTKNRKV